MGRVLRLRWLVCCALLISGIVLAPLTVPASAQQKQDPPTPLSTYRRLMSVVDENRLRTDITTFSSLGSRVPGYPGADKAAAMVEARFRALGLAHVRRQAFDTTSPVEEGTRMQMVTGGPAGLSTIPMHALWPNLVRTSQLPREGLAGPLVDGGGGDVRQYEGRPIRDAIVLMDFNCGMEWFNALLLGAKAVVFIAPEETLRGQAEAKFLTTPVNIPRFWVGRSEGLKLRQILKTQPVTVRLFCRMKWSTHRAYNIIGEIPGTDPELSKQKIVLQSYYDSMSVVPALAPGAESTCGLASLFQTADALKRNPPQRTVIVLATGAHFLGLEGAKQFIYNLVPYADRDQGDAFANKQAELKNYKAFISLDLSSATGRAGIFFKGYYINENETLLQWHFSDVGKKARETFDAVRPLIGVPQNDDNAFADGINPLKGKNWQTFLPGKLAFSSEIATLAGVMGIGFATVDDSRQRVDTPYDTVDQVNIPHLAKQLRPLICIIYNIVNTHEDILSSELPMAFSRVRGRVVEFDPKKSYMADQPVDGSLAVMRFVNGHNKSMLGVRGDPVDEVKVHYNKQDPEHPVRETVFEFDGAPMVTARGGNVRIEAYKVSDGDGRIIYAPDRGTGGAESYPNEVPIDLSDKQLSVVVFRCHPLDIYDMVDQRQFTLLSQMNIYDAATDAQPFEYGYSLPIQEPMLSYYEPCAVVYTKPDIYVKITMGASLIGLRFVLINATPQAPEGKGFLMSKYSSIPVTPYQVAKDMWTLDQDRMKVLQKYGINNTRVVEMHQRTKESLDAAKKALAEYHYDQFLTDVRAAWGYESKAYPDVQSTANDVVKGVLFYLALLLPFSYVCERLFFAFPDIRKQIAGTVGIFLIAFWILRNVHPAFDITITPLIVLLAFVIMALTAVVIYIVIQKFEEQMRQIKFETGGMHSADVGRLSASGAAFSLGISNMRRRKARTVLTCVTLIMLTFTVLSFTSVVYSTRTNKINLKKTPPYQGILIRDRQWFPLGEPTTRILRDEFSESYPVAPRGWFFSAMVGQQSFVDLQFGAKIAAATALVGMTPEEKDVSTITQALVPGSRWFTKSDVLGCIVPTGMAKLLGITPADIGKASVSVLGVKMPIIGLIDSNKLKNIKDLDGESLTPVDYQLMQERQQQQQGQQLSEGELQEYLHLAPDVVMFVPFDFVMSSGGNLRSVAIRFGNPKTVESNLDNLMERLELNLYAGVGKTTLLCSAIASTGVAGTQSLFVPILIAALIVLNTMLGSVYERVKEIGIYSSLGLAPVHIASLFIAEAFVYAVLGAISGYLIGQVLSKVLVTFHLATGLNLNYSSVSAVTSTCLVMGVVVLSTLYPARKAAEMSVPDVERRWKLPDPQGDWLRVPLPFTVSSGQAMGINSFLKEYMEAHADYSLGHFSTDQVQISAIETERGPGVRLHAMVWLAPYDLGVSEELILDTVPTEDEWVNEVHIQIRRESGDEASWLRTTRNFLNMVRKQFLIWRTFKVELKDQYVATGKELIASGD